MTATRFAGFPDRMGFVPVPAPFFGSLLREIDDLAELKTTLHLWRLLHEQRTSPRFVQKTELLADRSLLLALRAEGSPSPEATLEAALARATERGSLLALPVTNGDLDDVCYLLNTSSNQRIARDVEHGQRKLGSLRSAPPPEEVGGSADRLTIYALYEQNIGLLTPLLAEELRDAETTYPEGWIEDAFREAVSNNKRSWRYIRRVLENWTTRGRSSSGETGRRADPPEDSGRYLSGKFGRLVRR